MFLRHSIIRKGSNSIYTISAVLLKLNNHFFQQCSFFPVCEIFLGSVFSTVRDAIFTCTVTVRNIYTVFQKSDAEIQITITTTHLIRINYPFTSFNYCLSDTNVANFNKIHHMVSEQQLFKKWDFKTEFSNMENTY